MSIKIFKTLFLLLLLIVDPPECITNYNKHLVNKILLNKRLNKVELLKNNMYSWVNIIYCLNETVFSISFTFYFQSCKHREILLM